jgi:hypothetical protein
MTENDDTANEEMRVTCAEVSPRLVVGLCADRAAGGPSV